MNSVGTIWIITIVVSIVYLLYYYFKQQKANQEYANLVELAEYELEQAKNTFDNISLPVFQHILKEYGEDVAKSVAEGYIRVGMPVELLLVAWGEAEDIKKAVYKETVIEKWYYDGYYNRLSNKKYKTEVTIENSKIVGWKDLN